MAYEQRNNTGSMFANNDRKTDKHPNARGSALIDGVHYWVDSWTKTTQEGKKWQSLSFKRKDEQSKSSAKRHTAEQSSAPADFEDDSSIPF